MPLRFILMKLKININMVTFLSINNTTGWALLKVLRLVVLQSEKKLAYKKSRKSVIDF